MHPKIRTAASTLALMSLLLGCESTPPGTTRVVDGTGGTVTEAGARVDVPAGATSDSLEIGLRVISASDTAPLPADLVAAGPAVVVTPHGATFAMPVQITVPVTEGAADRVLRLDDEGDTTWEVVEAEVGATMAIVATDRFSIYMAASSEMSCATSCSLDNAGLSCAGCESGMCAGGGTDTMTFSCECDPASLTWRCCEGAACASPGADAGPSSCASECSLDNEGLSCAGCTTGAGCAAGGSSGSYECDCDPTTTTWTCCVDGECDASDAGTSDAGPSSCANECSLDNAGLSCAGCTTGGCAAGGPSGSYDCGCDPETELWVCTTS